MKARSRVRVGQCRLPPLHGRDEAREREDARRRRSFAREPERVAHHRAHREPAEDGALRADAGVSPKLVVEGGELGEGGVKALRIGVADTGNDVPVVARQAGERQRGARRDDVQAALRVERVGEAEQVVLVGAAAVVEDEQAVELPGRCAARGRRARSRRSQASRAALPAR